MSLHLKMCACDCLSSADKMLAAHYDPPGGPDNLYVKEVSRPVPREGEVLVQVHASALNRADLLQVCLELHVS